MIIMVSRKPKTEVRIEDVGKKILIIKNKKEEKPEREDRKKI